MDDVRYALRVFAKHPGVTAAAVLCLALAIGPNSTLFSILDAVFLRPLPLKDADRLVEISLRTDRGHELLSYPDYRDLRAQNTALSDLAAYLGKGAVLTVEGQQELILYHAVSENYFAVAGVNAALGRTFLRDEHLEAEPPVVISYSLWRRRFGGDPGVVGRTILLNGKGCLVIGVAPRGFRGLQWTAPVDAWVPLEALGVVVGAAERAVLGRREHRYLEVMGRLRPGVTTEQARRQLSSIAASLPAGASGKVQEVLLSPEEQKRTSLGAIVSTLVLSLVSLVLLVACANVANLLLAQADARRREIAIRLALGAGRRRLIRQLLTEGALLSLAAAAAGLLLAFWLIHLVAVLKPPIPITLDYGIRLDGRVVGYTMLLSLLTALVFGLAPALQASRPNLVEALKAGEGRLPSQWRSFSVRSVLVIAQIAVCQFLLCGAALLLRSYLETQRVSPGFDSKKNLLLLVVGPLSSGERRGVPIHHQNLAERLGALPGVRQASFAKSVPLRSWNEIIFTT